MSRHLRRIERSRKASETRAWDRYYQATRTTWYVLPDEPATITNLDADHAAALEREATIALLEKCATRKVDLAEELKSVGERGEATRCYGEAGTLSHAAQMIRNGAHHASTPPTAQERG